MPVAKSAFSPMARTTSDNQGIADIQRQQTVFDHHLDDRQTHPFGGGRFHRKRWAPGSHKEQHQDNAKPPMVAPRGLFNSTRRVFQFRQHKPNSPAGQALFHPLA